MRKVIFEGDSLEIIRRFPSIARQRCGYEIDRIQRNLKPLNWKPFRTVGQGVCEVRVRVGNQYRILYIVSFEDQLHVLHAFEKKTQRTRSSDIKIAKHRLKVLHRREGE